MQTYRLTGRTVVYDDGGNYTIKADKGYTLRNTVTGEQRAEVKGKSYTEWEAIECEAPAKPAKKAKK